MDITCEHRTRQCRIDLIIELYMYVVAELFWQVYVYLWGTWDGEDSERASGDPDT